MDVARWVHRARHGDRRALRVLYDAHLPAVYGFCRAFCRGDVETATELVQDSFVKAFASLGDLRDDDRFSGWLMTITRRTCLRWIEQRQREQGALTAMAAEPPPETSNHRDQIGVVVAEVIDACPHEAPREAARLFYTDPAHSTQDIAAALGVSRTAVTTRLQRFRAWAKAHMLSRLAAALETS